MEIRCASVQDAERLAEIYTPYVTETAVTFEYTAPSASEFGEKISRTLATYPYLVAAKNGKIIGYAYAGPFHAREAYKYSAEISVYVDRGFRKKRVGKALYTKLEKNCRNKTFIPSMLVLPYRISLTNI